MTFRGKFADSLVVEQLDKLSVSFLVDDLDIRRGGVAANICFGMGRLGLNPVLVGAVGEDFGDYRSWLERHGVNCDHVRVSESKHTARFVCTPTRPWRSSRASTRVRWRRRGSSSWRRSWPGSASPATC